MNDVLYRLPSVQGFALAAGAIMTEPMLDAEPVNAYVRQGVKQRVAAAMRRYENE